MSQTLREVLGELAGHSSLCWSPKPTGVFDSTEAGKAVDDAYAAILKMIPEKCSGCEFKHEHNNVCGWNYAISTILKNFEGGE